MGELAELGYRTRFRIADLRSGAREGLRVGNPATHAHFSGEPSPSRPPQSPVPERANEAGLAQIVRFTEELGIDCDLERKPAYVYSRSDDQVAEIEKEAEVARRLGLPASFVRQCPLPFKVAGVVQFDHQAQFSPCKYLLGLAQALRSGGGQIFEGTRARSIEHGEPCRLTTDQGVVTARDVIDATHMPLVSEGKFFAKAYPYAHVLVAARLEPARAPDGMFISAEQPTRSVRTARCGDDAWLVAAGGAFKPGASDEAQATLQDLAGFLRTEFGIDSVDYQWTNEDYQSMDGSRLSAGRALLPITSTSQPDSTPGALPTARRLG